jgi:hypothetical protein
MDYKISLNDKDICTILCALSHYEGLDPQVRKAIKQQCLQFSPLYPWGKDMIRHLCKRIKRSMWFADIDRKVNRKA